MLEQQDDRKRHSSKQMAIQSIYLISSLTIKDIQLL